MQNFARIDNSNTVVEIITLPDSLALADLFADVSVWIAFDPTTGPAANLAAGFVYDPVANSFTAPVTLTPPLPSTLAPLTFLTRLTADERSAIYAAAFSDPTNGVFDLLCQVMAANIIDLAHPSTVAGINAMVGQGLLTADRASDILAP